MKKNQLTLKYVNSLKNRVDSDAYSDSSALNYAYQELRRSLYQVYNIAPYNKIRILPKSILLLIYTENTPSVWHVISNDGITKFRKCLKATDSNNSLIRFKLLVDPEKQAANRVYKEYKRV